MAERATLTVKDPERHGRARRATQDQLTAHPHVAVAELQSAKTRVALLAERGLAFEIVVRLEARFDEHIHSGAIAIGRCTQRFANRDLARENSERRVRGNRAREFAHLRFELVDRHDPVHQTDSQRFIC